MLELVVVLAILAVLLALLIPSVQRVRQTAARTQCQNNLRQIGLALHTYHDTYRQLPAGCSFLDGASPQPHMSWLTRLLPFVEQEALWRESIAAFGANRFFLSQPHWSIAERVIPLYVCPLDSDAQEAAEMFPIRVAFTDYLGIWGTDLTQTDGVLFLDSAIRLTDIRDGTSSTLMVGERPPSSDRLIGWWYGGWGQNKTGSAEMVMGVRELNQMDSYRDCPPGPYRFLPPRQKDSVCLAFQFWSWHHGGGNFLYADGSVHFLRYSADHILPALATRAGNEHVIDP